MNQQNKEKRTKEICQRMVAQKRNHPAWLLLASRNAPLSLACLKQLMDAHPDGIELEDTVEELAQMFAQYANDTEFEIESDHELAARREIRKWLKRGLIVERNGQIVPTDSLQRALRFIEALDGQAMTSTASRLATVQRAIETLASQLSKNQTARADAIRKRIRLLEAELADVESGVFEVLSGREAEEGIQEVYQLAVSLSDDFRRVEDSYRNADRSLRKRILGQQQNRGEIVDELLDSHEALVKTNEGQVFDGFYEQLKKSAEIEEMKRRLRLILDDVSSEAALDRRQKTDLRLLVSRLVNESERVIQARARSEKDVRGFLTSGLADEQIRVGAILQQIFNVALHVDWTSQKIRRTRGPLPPVGVTAANLPVVERLMVKEISSSDQDELDFSTTEVQPESLDDEFWNSWKALDRTALFESTIAELQESGKPMTLSELATALPPTHDLETLAYWLTMAREAGIEMGDARETFDLVDEDDTITRFDTPMVRLDDAAMKQLDVENLE